MVVNRARVLTSNMISNTQDLANAVTEDEDQEAFPGYARPQQTLSGRAWAKSTVGCGDRRSVTPLSNIAGLNGKLFDVCADRNSKSGVCIHRLRMRMRMSCRE